ncbi:MAG: Phosphoenolpyruvate synthase, partial [Candidatus Woesebacteria bacterium GW2011_GWB1_40_101]
MVRARPLTLFFKDIDKEDIPSVGGKGANLGEMAGAGFPVPAGFAVTVSAYDRFLEENDLPLKIKKILDSLDVNNPEELNKASKDIQKIIKNSKIPSDVATEIISAYKKLSGLFKEALVAVRSSATAEDLPKASFAGQQATFLNTKGDTNLLIYVRECWASLFTPRSIFYRVENKIPHEIVKISVIVQKMIQSEASGVIFTIDPVTNEKDRIVIEAVWGLGEMIVQGSVVPDKYVVQKDTFLILSKEISDQPIELTRVGATTKEREVPLAKKDKQKISDEEIVKLARIAAKLHAHYFFPQDIEWAKEGKNLYIVQTRPITTTDNANAKITKEEEKKLKMEKSPILVGAPASPGIGTGIVKILESAKEINKIHQGDVLVTSMTSPDFVPAMKKASAIVTDKGGQTSHAAIVSRELGIPCVVGCENATAKLREGMVITVDGAKGEVYLGSRTIKEVKIKVPQAIIHAKTATKIYVNLAEVERAGEVAKLNVDGVGLLRAEFMIAGIGIHPKEAIKRKEQGRFIEKLANSLEVFCKAFNPR